MKEKLKRKEKSVLSKAKTILEFTREVIALIPNKEDSLLSGTIKALCIAGKLLPENNKEMSYIKSGFIRTSNRQLVSLIEGLNLEASFDERECDSITKNDILYELKLYDPEIGTLILQSSLSDDNKLIYSSTFFHSADFDFNKLFELAWETSGGNLELTSSKGNYGSRHFRWFSFVPIVGKQFGSVNEKIEKFCEENRSFRKESISRSYLFIGPPGCGKSTLAQKFSTDNFSRVLKVGAETLYSVIPNEFIEIIGYLKPECIFVDEIDKPGLFYNNWDTGSNVLSLLETVKELHPEITLLFTANKITPLPEPMIRPGRIDDIIEFDRPDEADCKAILLGYLNKEIKNIDDLAKECVGLSPAHIKEVAFKINTGNGNILQTITKMVKYIKIKEQENNK